ncbi:hypothetical protein [Pseudomonas viridiflava]|uniref:hypothetical protein n=1 Tax=Pseudomonas viridiflava TaxID=33069 RepID=UPI002EA9C123|nr:hypothetical protein [Pseudomonas viridiflava]MEE3930018.1 hypothetical protein [Pseudomonas viridiflava]MEE3940227.1 hypothetical protein [Pseudomonas viridiflava]MEE3966255.1 hypothetical protein [Pseudomonas viridiflava]MEE3980315.1 hypothetical protein [Pseudomonas viridiflava]
MKILIVEDDDYKLERIRSFAALAFGGVDIRASESLKGALEAVADDIYDLIFVDMAIPSHPTIAGQGTPVPFNTGGLAVLMELAALDRHDPCIIITQYPDIEISGEYIPIDQVREKLPLLLECEVLACVFYDEDKDSWQDELSTVFKELKL